MAQEEFDVKRYIRGSNAIEGIYEDAEIEQSLKAWEFLTKQDEVTHAVICEVQKIITANQSELKPEHRGNYRSFCKVNVTVGGRYAPDHSLVDSLMQGWLADLPKMQPLIGHVRFESIHPFVDGNGRTGRMIYWFVCLINGKMPKYYGIDRAPELTEQENREWYYRLFDNKRVVELSNNNWGINFTGEVKKDKK